MTPRVSVVIPTMGDHLLLPETLGSVGAGSEVEAIVIEAGPRPLARAAAESVGAAYHSSTPGRARQMNLGARLAQGRILLFLHADTRLPDGWLSAVETALANDRVAAGAFRLGISAPGLGLRLVEGMANLRSRWLGLPYGDQAIFLRRVLFFQMGGFPDMPLMEDFELIRRLRRRGRIAIARQAVQTSPRRWRRLGVTRTTLLNQVIVAGYYLGVPPITLARWYLGKTRG